MRTILLNPRYTGRQVWNKQRTDEVLIDVEDISSDMKTSTTGRTPPNGCGRHININRRDS